MMIGSSSLYKRNENACLRYERDLKFHYGDSLDCKCVVETLVNATFCVFLPYSIAIQVFETVKLSH